MAIPVQLLAIGVIRSAAGILLVRQTTVAAESGTAWVLPGGRVSPHELAIEALAREIREETGLTVEGMPRLAGVAHMVNPTTIQRDEGEIPAAGGSVVVLAYEVTSFSGSIGYSGDPDGDPDGDVVETAWHEWDAAVSLLTRHPYPFVSAVARMALGLDASGHCYYRRDHNGEDKAWQG